MVNRDYQAYRSDSVTIGDWKFVVEGWEEQREREKGEERKKKSRTLRYSWKSLLTTLPVFKTLR